MVSKYLFNSLLGLDLSGRAGTAQRQGKLRGRIFALIINALAFNRNHCREAIDGDIARAKAVIADDQKA